MHELSIAESLIQVASEYARENAAERIVSVTIRVGALSCVHQSALEFSFEVVAQGTMLEGARLHYVEVPVSVYCGTCELESPLPGIQDLRCPNCGVACGDLRSGRELDIESIEIIQGANQKVSG